MGLSPKDMLNRPLSINDYVVYFNRVYQVLGVGKADRTGYGSVRMILIDKSKSTRETVKYSKEMCMIPAGDVLIWKLTQ